MKGGAENRKKTITLGVLGAVALCGVLYNLSSLFSSAPSTPPPAVAPVSNAPAPVRGRAAETSGGVTAASPYASRNSSVAAIPGVAAQRLASTSASLDPTLDEAAMLRTESLVYSGSGRNIFSATYVAPASVRLPANMPPARPTVQRPVPPPYMGPPGPPPIPLKFFGTAERPGRPKQAFLLSGEDVYLASPGDIVAKRFRVGQIQPFGVTVTDLGSNNTQTLPLQQQ